MIAVETALLQEAMGQWQLVFISHLTEDCAPALQ